MRYLITESFTLKTPKSDLILPVGKIIELSPDQAEKLGGKVRLADELDIPKISDTVSVFCESYGGHCSGRLPQNKYPAECLQIKCEHYQPKLAEEAKERQRQAGKLYGENHPKQEVSAEMREALTPAKTSKQAAELVGASTRMVEPEKLQEIK